MAPRLTVEQRQLARRLSAEGWSLRAIGRQVACSHEAVRLVVEEKQTHVVKPYAWAPAAGRLGMCEREEISLGLERGETMTAIARRLGRVTSTVSREVRATAAGTGIERGVPTSEPMTARGGPRFRSWRVHGLRARSASGWRSGGRPKRSPAVCASSFPTIR